MPQDLGTTNIIANQLPNTGAFTPDAQFLPPSGDSYQQLFNLIQNLQNQQQPVQQQSKLQTILGALAQGGAILASKDPGGTLAGFINAKAQADQQKQQNEFNRRGQLNAALIQGVLDKARGITAEQQQARQEGRQFQYKGQEAQLQVATQQQIDLNKLDLAEKQAVQDNDLLNRFSQDQATRKKRDALAAAAPELFQKGIELQSLIETLVPEIPREIAESIAQKRSGQLPPNYTPVENQWYQRFAEARAKEFAQDKDVKRRVAESQISKNLGEAQYYRNSKIQDKYQNALNTNLGNALADSIDPQYYVTKSGQILGDKQVRQLSQADPTWGLINKPQPLPPDQNILQIQKAVQKQREVENLVRQQTTQVPGQPTAEAQDPYLNKLKTFIQQGHTREEAMQEVLNSTTLPQELKAQYIQLISNNFGGLGADLAPATQKQNKPKPLPAGAKKQDFLNIRK